MEKRLRKNLSKKQRARVLANIEDVVKNMNMSLTEITRFSYYYYPGWPLILQFKRYIDVSNRGISKEVVKEVTIELL